MSPVNIPEHLQWEDFDISMKEQIEEVYDLLVNNYVEDDEGTFRFDYSREFIQWALQPPNYKKELFFGLRDKTKEGKLIGFISGIILTL